MFENESYPLTFKICTFKKAPSFFGRKFELYKENEFQQGEEERIKLGLTMMVLLERRRG